MYIYRRDVAGRAASFYDSWRNLHLLDWTDDGKYLRGVIHHLPGRRSAVSLSPAEARVPCAAVAAVTFFPRNCEPLLATRSSDMKYCRVKYVDLNSENGGMVLFFDRYGYGVGLFRYEGRKDIAEGL